MAAEKAGSHGRVLRDLHEGKEVFQAMLIEDSATVSGRCLLECIVDSLLHRSVMVHMVALDTPPQRWTAITSHPGLVVHDYFSDPLGWESSVGANRIKDFESFSVPPQAPAHSKSLAVVVLDSLSPLLGHHPLSVVCQQLLKLSKEHAVMALLHTDLHDSHVTLALEHQFPTVVRLGAAKGGHLGVAQTRHLRKSGKVLKSSEYYIVGKDLSLKTEPATKDESQIVEEPTPDPTANLTFSLTLTEREKGDRAKAPLPYVKSEQQKTQLLNPAGSGKIFYTPDDADDFDDSDPDDDLDI